MELLLAVDKLLDIKCFGCMMDGILLLLLFVEVVEEVLRRNAAGPVAKL